MIGDSAIPLSDCGHKIVVVGSGPAGLVAALELRRLGLEVLVLESGVDGYRKDIQDLADAAIVDPRRHAPMSLAVRRALGGTSLLWGGRCVAFDDIDFVRREHVPFSGWPISHEEIRPWYAVGGAYLDMGEAIFSTSGPLTDEAGECQLGTLERWSNASNLRRLHADVLAKDPGLRVCTGSTVVGIDIDPVTGRVHSVTVAMAAGERVRLRARAFVLACGGLETTRLLLSARTDRPRLFQESDNALGRYYMGHLSGKIADIIFADAATDAAFDFELDRYGRYRRRRITISEDAQLHHGLLNLSAYPDNAPLNDPAHGSGALSLAYLALAMPGIGSRLVPEAIRRVYVGGGVRNLRQHFSNVILGMPGAISALTKFGYKRYIARTRLPGFFLRNIARRYALHYHAEQAPSESSIVHLSHERDARGMPRLTIDLRYSQDDARSVVRSHTIIDRNLREAGIGHLEFRVPESDRESVVLSSASDGFHQLGTTRMSSDPTRGVVDRDCRVHGTSNLFIASSSVFPTSGQANPTLLIAALSARLAAHLARIAGDLPGA